MTSGTTPPVSPHTEVIELHGHRVVFRRAGRGPVVLLIHGIAGTNAVWNELIPALARSCTVIAPDLPGHGESGQSAGDYSLGAMAAALRDLLLACGEDRATLVGHSLGGGVAMQFSYLFPEFTERLVLISSGGLGRTVNPVLRSAALPGAELVTAGLGQATRAVGTLVRRLPRVPGVKASPQFVELERSVGSLADARTRAAFHSTLRAVVGPDGQRVFAGDRLYLAEVMPTLILWGARDRVIPLGHAHRAHAAMPASRLVILEGAGHFPSLERPEEVLAAISGFMAETEPAVADRERFRVLLRRGVVGAGQGSA